MKSLIIVTNKLESEIHKFIHPNAVQLLNILSGNQREIIVINNSVRGTIVNDSLATLMTKNSSKIILYHGAFTGYENVKIFVGTDGRATIEDSERWYYEKLFNAIDKWTIFDEVWNYFSKKVERLQLKKSQEVYFNECIAESKWKELPELFATPIIIEKWNELKAKSFDSQAPDYDVFYKLFEDTWQE